MSGSECEQEPEVKKVKYSGRKSNSVQEFHDWRLQRGEPGISEQICLEYFQDLAQRKSFAVLNMAYYALKHDIQQNYGIDLKEFGQLKAFINQKANEHSHSKKNKVILSDEHIKTFIRDASDHFHLLDKVVIILAMMTKCTSTELLDIHWKEVHKHSDELILVDLPKNTKMKRAIVIRGGIMKIVQKYRELRPKDAKTDKFLLAYDKGRCKKMSLGINKLKAVIKEVASYLKLPNSEVYSFWSFRRCSPAIISTIFDKNTDCDSKKQNATSNKEGHNSQGVNPAGEARRTNAETEASVEDNLNETDDEGNLCGGNEAHVIEDAKIHIRIDNKTIHLRPSAKYWMQSTSYQNENGNLPPSANDTNTNGLSESEFDFNEANVSVNQHVNDTNMSQEHKTVTLIFKNCQNVSNITINL